MHDSQKAPGGLIVEIYEGDAAQGPIGEELVKLSGPVNRERVMSPTMGGAFKDLPPGDYQVRVRDQVKPVHVESGVNLDGGQRSTEVPQVTFYVPSLSSSERAFKKIGTMFDDAMCEVVPRQSCWREQ